MSQRIDWKLPSAVYWLIGYCALYTGVWGGVMYFDPEAYFSFGNMDPKFFPPSVEFWGWFGIAGGVFYGGYLFVYRRAPYLAFISAIISLAGTISSFYMWLAGPLTGEMAAIHLSGDIAGTIGFGWAAWLEYAARRNQRINGLYQEGHQAGTGGDFEAVLANALTQKGKTLLKLSQQKEVLLVFLRHFGCTFCREALADLKTHRAELDAAGKEIVLVHMVDEATAAKHIGKYGLEDVHQISDPEKHLYRGFELQRATFQEVFGLRNWIEGFRAGILKGHLVGRETGDGWQMPGAFLLHQGQIKAGFRHESAADRPDYCRLAECQA